MADPAELTVPRRNGAAVEQRLREQDAQIREQQKRIDAMVASYSMLADRLTAIEQYVAVQRIKLMGTGPTQT